MDLQLSPFSINLGTVNLKYKGQKFLSGHRYHITGPTGVGKSTYFRYLLHLTLPSQSASPCPYPRETFAWVPQDFQLGTGRVSDLLVELFSGMDSFSFSKKKTALLAILETWDWKAELMERTFHDLSGGEKQRLALALGLLSPRPWILIDEGLTGIDPQLLPRVLQSIENSPQGVLAISHQELPYSNVEVHHGGN